MIVGVDPAMRRLAISRPDFNVSIEVPMLKDRRDIELSALAQSFYESVPSEAEVWCERVILGANGNALTCVSLAMTVGAISAVHPGAVYLVSPSSWKAKVVGHGSANKQAVADWLAESHPELAERCTTKRAQDLADATCIRLYGCAVAAERELVAPGSLSPDPD